VHVGAKDLGTGKTQSIQITANSGLSEEEIKKMKDMSNYNKKTQ
jgi:molecular chaperone DnaK